MEYVILVDDQNRQIGVAPKDTVHTKNTPLHRAFSLFLFNTNHQLLVTKRASTKKTFPGVWTNSVCGHVAPDEEPIDAVKRRLQEELQMSASEIREVSPYRYRFMDVNGIVENEICPIFVGYADEIPKPNPEETEDWKWIDWNEFIQTVHQYPGTYSPWSEEEAKLLESRNIFDR